MTDFNPSEHLIDIQGKQYLEIRWRLVWLRDAQPDALIKTTLISHTSEEAVFMAEIVIPAGGSATGYGAETQADFGDYLEKAETKALGRACAALGFGTQFCDDYDEGDSVTDAPIERRAGGAGESAMTAKFPGTCGVCGYAIAEGTPIFYNHETKMARHQECPAENTEPIKAATTQVMSGVVDEDPGPQEP